MSNSTRTTDIVVRFDAETGKLVTGMARAERSVTQKIGAMGKSMQSASKSMMRNLTLPIAGFLGASAKMAIDFDRTMTRVGALTDISAEQMKGLRKEIVKSASAYGTTAQSAAEAFYFIASSGVEGKDAIDVLNNSLKGAAIGMGDTQVLADLLTSAMNAYGSEVLSATKATDLLVQAVKLGKAEPSQLAGAMSQVLPVASAMGVGFGDLAAGFAALSKPGTSPDEAATQLTAALSALLKPSKQAEKQMNAYGLSSVKLQKQLKNQGLLSVLTTLREKFKGNNSALAEAFPNIRALRGLMYLIGADWEGVKDIFEAMPKSVGQADAAMDKTRESMSYKWDASMNRMRNSMGNLGGTLAPNIDQVATAIDRLAKFIEGMSPSSKKFATNVALMVAAFAPLLWVVGKLLSMFERLAALAVKFPRLGKLLGFAGKAVPGATGTAALTTGMLVADKVLGADTAQAQKARSTYAASQLASNPASIARGNDLMTARYMAMQRSLKTRAIGGTVVGNSSYLVGERGPELFTPTSSGHIFPNGSGGGSVSPVVVNLNVAGSVVRERDLASSVRDEIAQLMRRRGLDPSILGV